MYRASRSTRDSIEDIWGPRTPFCKEKWPDRVDQSITEEPDKWVQSACVLCSNGCGMDIGVKDGKMVGVRGRVQDRVNRGRLGPKGLAGWTSIASKDRLLYPQIRKNGKLERASWDEAMDLIVKKSKAIVDKLTAHGVGFYTSGQLFLEEYYALAVIGKAGLSTLHMDGNTRLCTATAAASMRESFGSDGQPGSYTDIDHTDCIMMVGHNMAATQTVLFARVLDRLAGHNPPKLIVIDPRKSQTAQKATIHLAPRIGTNLALLNGIQHLLFKNGKVNRKWCSDHVIGLAELEEKVSHYPPDVVEKITGVPVSQLEATAEILGSTKSLLSTALQGVYQSNQATASACQVNNINLLLGLIGSLGSGILQMNGQPTAQNNREAGCDGEFPGFRNNMNPRQMQELADLWNIPLERVPYWGQPTHIENMLNYIANGSMEFFWISGTNPLVSLPNLPKVRDLLSKETMFVVVQDIFMTETAMVADVVLPAAQWGEKTGCFTNVDRTVHISHKAVEPPGECRSDLDIFLDYAKRMEFKDKDGNLLLPYKTSEEVFKAWQKMSEGRPCDYTGMSYEKLTGGSGIQWPCNEKYPDGKERLFEDGHFFTETEMCESWGHDLETGAPYTKDQYLALNPNGRAILKACHYKPSPEEVNDEYPFQLSTGRNVYHFHTRSKTGRSKPLQDACPESYAEIHEDDAKAYDIEDGDEVVVTSRRGAIQVKVRVTKIGKGRVFIPFHFGAFDSKTGKAQAANELTTEQWDPVSKQPMFKGGAVKIKKVPKGSIQVLAPEQHSSTVRRVEAKHLTAKNVGETRKRERHLSLWLGATFQSIEMLLPIYADLIPAVIHDMEISSGLEVLKDLTISITKHLKPFYDKYEASTEYGMTISKDIIGNLFPKFDGESNAYEALIILLCLKTYYATIEAHLIALLPAAQALWDKDFRAAVEEAQSAITRMQGWVTSQIAVRAPQTLVVPSLVKMEDMRIEEAMGHPEEQKQDIEDAEAKEERKGA